MKPMSWKLLKLLTWNSKVYQEGVSDILRSVVPRFQMCGSRGKRVYPRWLHWCMTQGCGSWMNSAGINLLGHCSGSLDSPGRGMRLNLCNGIGTSLLGWNSILVSLCDMSSLGCSCTGSTIQGCLSHTLLQLLLDRRGTMIINKNISWLLTLMGN